VSGQRAGVSCGIGYTLALLAWFMLQLHAGGHPAASAKLALQGLLVTQYLLIPLLAPWLVQDSTTRGAVINLAMLALVPLPFLLVLQQVGAATPGSIGLSQALALVLAALSYLVVRKLPRRRGRGLAGHPGSATFQVLAITLVWAGRDHWLHWLGM